MPSFNPTPDVSSRYGAPMGRVCASDLDTDSPIRLFPVPLDSGGYDSGGAYWGHGEPIWCAADRDGDCVYIRAATLAAAQRAIADRFDGATFG